MITDQLLARFPLISDQVDEKELRALLTELELLLKSGARGAVVEFGCYIGTTSLFIRRLLDAYGATGEYHVYDSFAGLPEKTREDQSAVGAQFQRGELTVSKKSFIEQFKKAGLRMPRIHKCWFADVVPEEVPDDIMFAFFDGDFYESIRDSFRACEGKFADRAVIVVDDYAAEALPGAAQATDEWARTHGVNVRTIASLGIIK